MRDSPGAPHLPLLTFWTPGLRPVTSPHTPRENAGRPCVQVRGRAGQRYMIGVRVQAHTAQPRWLRSVDTLLEGPGRVWSGLRASVSVRRAPVRGPASCSLAGDPSRGDTHLPLPRSLSYYMLGELCSDMYGPSAQKKTPCPSAGHLRLGV